jgi:hypothetical protein
MEIVQNDNVNVLLKLFGIIKELIKFLIEKINMV